MIEGLLQSNLKCFFQIDCLRQLENALNISHLTVPPLFNSSHYDADTTVSEIVQNLMIDQWGNAENYLSYFNQCQPNICTATYVSRRNIIYIITATVGLIGGLTSMYKFLVPLLMTFILRFLSPLIQQKFNGRRVMSIDSTATVHI